jgi:S1-C subfamily serine protease
VAVSDESDDWEISPRAQPRPGNYGFDLDRALSAVVGLSARVSTEAYTADTLGVERGGNGVVIRDDGVVLTIGYLITEAEEVLLETCRGRVVAGHVLGYDGGSGFGLVQALEPLDLPSLKLGDSRHAGVGESVILAGAGGRRHSVAADIVARQEFAGYWEYLIEEAIFTAPGHPNWGGAALIGPAGDLLGVGSLQLQHQVNGGRVKALNMVVPIELLIPIYEELLTGKMGRTARPWLGVYAHEMERHVVIVGVADKGPADRAGLRKGDIVKVAAGMDIANLADFYRSMWALGGPGIEVPLTLEREGDVFELRITSADRRQFLKTPRLH